MRKNIPLMTIEELEVEFEQQDGFILNKHSVDFELHETGQVIATHSLTNNREYGYWIDLIADYSNLEELIQANQLRSLKDIDRIKSSALWVRYLQGDGYVVCDIDEIDAEVCFRIVKGITMVYSGDLSFYQEVVHVLSMKEQFAAFIEQNMPRFGIAAAMRPVMLPQELWVPGMKVV